MGSAEVAGAPDPLVEALRLSARRPENARSVASLMHAIDRFRRPRPESVLSDAELAAIQAPTAFLLGTDDPYLSVGRARPSIERIPGATLHEADAAHAPWLVDPAGAAQLVTGLLAGQRVQTTCGPTPLKPARSNGVRSPLL
jgi:pimeloyl-ACP methyl ester carboxylesterase